jgi:2-enoate reductase
LENLKVKIELNKEITSKAIEKANPEVVILATGAIPRRPAFPGIDKENVFTYEDYLRDEAEIGEKVVVLGGNHGAEIALSLAKSGKKVTIVEESANTASTPYIYLGRMLVLQSFLREENVEILTESKVMEISDNGVVVIDKEQKQRVLDADTVIVALGREPNKNLANSLDGEIPEIYEIGDCVEPLNILSAVNQAAIVARQV